MFPIFQHTLARFRGAILGWGVSLALLAMYMMPFYDTLVEQQDSLRNLLASYPPELLAFFGEVGDLSAGFFTAEGYLGFEFFSYMPLVLGIFAVLAGSGMLASDEENGTLDLVLAHPVSRTRLFLGRLLGSVGALVGILGVIWLGLVIGKLWSSIELTAAELARPLLSLGAVLSWFLGLALILSLLLPSRRLAATVSGIVLVGSFFLTSLARLDENLEGIAKFSPLKYYQSSDAISSFNERWLAGLLAMAALFVLLAWWRFERRDIRVVGEAGWGLRWLRRRSAAAGR